MQYTIHLLKVLCILKEIPQRSIAYIFSHIWNKNANTPSLEVGCFWWDALRFFWLSLLTTVKRLFKTSCVRILDTKCDRLCRCTVLSLLIQIESEHSNLFSKSNQSLHCSFLFQLSFPNQVLLTILLYLLYSKVSSDICCFMVRV